MEVPEMEGKIESHTTSAEAFVEGGIQEACHDACSICLEDFCDSDPASVTNCKHEFHLHCILEWYNTCFASCVSFGTYYVLVTAILRVIVHRCQRSSQCPMCWQSVSLKDATSQELLEAVEQERSIRVTPSRNVDIFHHPTLDDPELQQFEERIIQHIAAAAAMRRARHLGHREGPSTRSSAHGHPHFLLFSAQSSAHPSSPESVAGDGNELAEIPVGSPSTPLTSDGDEPSTSQLIAHIQTRSPSLAHRSTVSATNREGIHPNESSTTHSSTLDGDRAGPSDLQSFSDSLRSKFNAMSLRYKESLSKGTRGWKERLFSRNSSVSELGSEVKRELNAGIASVSRLMERLESRENNRVGDASLSNHLADSSIPETSNQHNVEALGRNSSRGNNSQATFSTGSDSN
ncbi:hypothetical protein Ahy_A02g005743 isoform A [Arachis hypogaea]|uniref:RING-type E3 ubiquitin transferase n=1 Tax=Arachis hypogaea TaxID=3818 RepID=A0A445E7S9_ARAHY|nr:hypothetical protein Ahy_A02g005743 isoform A [Arachis hypogaea]